MTSKTASTFWVDQFKRLDKAMPSYNATKVTDWNKVMNHYRSSGLPSMKAGIPAHNYNEYRAGNMTLEQAAA